MKCDNLNKGIVLMSATMSLDGFIAEPNDSLDWVFKYDWSSNPLAKEVMDSIGVLLVGRNTYNVGKRAPDNPHTGKPFEGAWTGHQFVLTHNPPQNNEDESTTFINEDIKSAIKRSLNYAKGKNVNVLGANVTKQCIEEKLLDEIIIQIVPVLLGDGVRLFDKKNSNNILLEPITIASSGVITNLHYKLIY